jgi:hypothetical protein
MIGDKISQRKIDLKGKFQNQECAVFIDYSEKFYSSAGMSGKCLF